MNRFYLLLGGLTGGVIGIAIGALSVVLSDYVNDFPLGIGFIFTFRVVLYSVSCLFPGIISGATGAIVFARVVQPIIGGKENTNKEMQIENNNGKLVKGTVLAIIFAALTSILLLGWILLCSIWFAISCNNIAGCN